MDSGSARHKQPVPLYNSSASFTRQGGKSVLRSTPVRWGALSLSILPSRSGAGSIMGGVFRQRLRGSDFVGSYSVNKSKASASAIKSRFERVSSYHHMLIYNPSFSCQHPKVFLLSAGAYRKGLVSVRAKPHLKPSIQLTS